MPAKPAAVEKSAPVMKATAVIWPTKKNSNAATTTTKTDSSVYSRRRNTIAPLVIWPAMSAMVSLPIGRRFTANNTTIAITRPIAPRAGTAVRGMLLIRTVLLVGTLVVTGFLGFLL